MANNNAQATGTVYLDTTAAQVALDRLNARVRAYDEELGRANVTASRRITLEANRADAATRRTRIEDQLARGLGVTYNQQRSLVNALVVQLRGLPVNTQQYIETLARLRSAQGVFNEMRQNLTGVANAQREMINQSPALTRIGVFFASFAANLATGLVSSLQSAVSGIFNMRIEFEKSLQNLSAITGATGKDLDFLKDSAIELSKSGSASATEYVEAFKLVASAKPELLAAKEDLVGVTTAAKLLAEASGLDLPDAATRLTDALNQFGAPAQQAGAYVDALAAASKYGSAEVPQLTEALLKFGTLAKTSNITIYESAAAIELLAERGLKGAEAGTQLRNVLLKLSTAKSLDKKAVDALAEAGVNTDILQDKTESLEVRLRELSKVQNNTNAMAKIFGSENVIAGQIILQNIPRYAALADQIKEQGVAAEQAAINTDTLANRWQEFKNLLSSFFLEGTNSPVKKAIEGLTLAAKGLKNIIDNVIAGLKLSYELSKLAILTAKDLATLNPGRAAARVAEFTEEKKAAQERLETIKKLTEAQQFANTILSDATTLTIADQKRLLKQNLALQEASFTAYNEVMKNGTKNTAEGKRVIDQLYRDVKIVQGLKKLIKDGEAALNSNAGEPANDVNDGDADKRNQLLSEVQAFNKKLKDLNFEAEQAAKSDDQRQIDAIREKYKVIFQEYEKLSKKIVGTSLKLDFTEEDLKNAENREIEAAFAKQKQKVFEDSEKRKKESLTKSYQDQQELTVRNYEVEKNLQAERFINGEIEKATYEANLLKIEEASKKQQLTNAELFAATMVTIEGKIVPAVEDAAKDVTRLKKEELEKQTRDAIAAYEAQIVERDLIDKLDAKGRTARSITNILIAKGKGNLNEEYKERQLQLERERTLSLKALEQEKQDRLNNIKETGAARLAAESIILTAIGKQEDQINAEFEENRRMLEVQRIAAKMERDLDYAQKALDIYQQFANAREVRENAQLAREVKTDDIRKKALKKQLDSKLISQQEYNRQINNIDKETEAKKQALAKKQFERDKRIQIAQTLINGAAGAIRLFVSPGFPTAIPLAIALGIQTLASVAFIAAQKFALGGMVRPTLIKNGRIDSSRNIPTQPNGDDVLATVKVGEVILNQDQQRRAGGPAFFNALGVPGFNGGGRVVPFWHSRPYQSLNYREVVRSKNITRFAEGGMVLKTPTETKQTDIQTIQDQSILNGLNVVMEKLLYSIENPVAPNVNITLKSIEDAQKLRDQIRIDGGAIKKSR